MSDHLLKAKEVAERLNISRSQAFALMRNGNVPIVKFGKLVRVRPEDLEEFIEKNSVGATKTYLPLARQVCQSK
jgi:excisionase family DNA binding protein